MLPYILTVMNKTAIKHLNNTKRILVNQICRCITILKKSHGMIKIYPEESSTVEYPEKYYFNLLHISPGESHMIVIIDAENNRRM